MATAKSGDTVKLHYTGKLEDGTVFDSSEGGDPLEFTLGTGHVIEGFELAVVGMTIGDEKTAEIASDSAYGKPRDDLRFEVERSMFPEDITLEVGIALEIRQDNGQSLPVKVSELGDESVTLDANHPLAGKDLIFDLKLVEIVEDGAAES